MRHAVDGRMGLRLLSPCRSRSGEDCEFYEDPENLHLAETRWYATGLRLHDGSIVSIPFFQIQLTLN